MRASSQSSTQSNVLINYLSEGWCIWGERVQLQRLSLVVEVTANHHDGLRFINLDFGDEILDRLDPPDPALGVRQVDVHQVDLEVVADEPAPE